MDSGPRIWIAALRNSHERLAALVRQISPEQLTNPSYASEWTIAQVLSHLGSGAEIAQFSIAAALVPDGPIDQAAIPAIWQAWNAKSPQQQAADCLSLNEARISRLERLTDAELARMHLSFGGMDLDASGFFGLALAEHAVHTWDIAVVLDPAAVVSPDAVALLAGRLPMVARWAGKPGGAAFRARLRASDSDVDYLLDVAEQVTLAPWPGPGGTGPAAEIILPAEAMVRLVYGRLDPGHTPAAATAGGAALDQVRAVFPGF